MELGFRHAALFGGLGGAFVFMVVAITGVSVGITYLLLLLTGFLLTLVPPLIADSERREARRQAHRQRAVRRQR